MNWNLNGQSTVLSAAGADNDNANFNNIISTIKEKKLYVLVVTSLAENNQNFYIF